MSWTSGDSAIRVTNNLEKQIEGAGTTAEILGALVAAAQEQELITRDPYSGEPVPTEKAFNNPDAKMLTRVLTINGTTYEISGRDDAEINDLEIGLHRYLQSEPVAAEQQRDANGRFAAEYVDPDPEGLVARWSEASDAFRQAHPEYEPSDSNKQLLANKLIELGKTGEPSLAALEAAYRAVAGSLSAPEFAARLAEAQSADEVAALTRGHFGTNGMLFNRI